MDVRIEVAEKLPSEWWVRAHVCGEPDELGPNATEAEARQAANAVRDEIAAELRAMGLTEREERR
jgi:hypothetical protein